MSIQSEITRISGNVSDALTAIEAKGVTVPSGTTSDDLATLIAQISGGGSGPTYETYFDGSITAASDKSISISSLSSLYFASGETWRVTWDGTEYTCSPNIHEGWLWYIGNHGLTDGTDDGTGEPFCLYNYGGGAMNGVARTAGTHTLKLEKQTSSGGGSATLITKTITENGTYSASDDSADGYSSVTVTVPTGGASNHVTGTFTGTTTNAAMNIQIPYTGNGYPIAVMVFPTEGPYNSASGTFYSKIQRYACAYYTGIKARADRAPTYNASSSDTVATYSRYKNNTSSATSYSGTAANNTSLFTSDDAQNTVGHIVHIKPNNILSVFIASNSYGFMANVEYTYHIIYSE